MNLIDIFYLRDKHGYGPQKYTCNSCGVSFSSWSELHEHKKTHRVIKRRVPLPTPPQQKKMRRERMRDIKSFVELVPNVSKTFYVVLSSLSSLIQGNADIPTTHQQLQLQASQELESYMRKLRTIIKYYVTYTVQYYKEEDGETR